MLEQTWEVLEVSLRLFMRLPALFFFLQRTEFSELLGSYPEPNLQTSFEACLSLQENLVQRRFVYERIY